MAFVESYLKFKKMLSEYSFQMKLNPTMLVINIVLISVILTSQILYWCFYGEYDKQFYSAFVAQSLSRLFDKAIYLVLLQTFSRQITVKSVVLANGKILIIGCDDAGKEIFSYEVQRKFAVPTEGDDQS